MKKVVADAAKEFVLHNLTGRDSVELCRCGVSPHNVVNRSCRCLSNIDRYTLAGIAARNGGLACPRGSTDGFARVPGISGAIAERAGFKARNQRGVDEDRALFMTIDAVACAPAARQRQQSHRRTLIVKMKR